MAFEEDFSGALDASTVATGKKLRDRAQEEEQTVLTSGRTPPDVADLAAELHAVVSELWKASELS